MRRIRYILASCLFLIGLLTATDVFSQNFAIKTNVLYDATATPNLQAEVKVAPRHTVGVSAGFNPWPLKENFTYDGDNRKMRHVLVQPMWRYWFCSAFAGHFVSTNVAYIHYNVSNIKFPLGLYPGVDKERRQGNTFAIGASYGYSWILSPRWSIEAEGGVDVGYANSKRYKYHHCGMYMGNEKHAVLMPKLALNFILNIM